MRDDQSAQEPCNLQDQVRMLKQCVHELGGQNHILNCERANLKMQLEEVEEARDRLQEARMNPTEEEMLAYMRKIYNRDPHVWLYVDPPDTQDVRFRSNFRDLRREIGQWVIDFWPAGEEIPEMLDRLPAEAADALLKRLGDRGQLVATNFSGTKNILMQWLVQGLIDEYVLGDVLGAAGIAEEEWALVQDAEKCLRTLQYSRRGEYISRPVSGHVQIGVKMADRIMFRMGRGKFLAV